MHVALAAAMGERRARRAAPRGNPTPPAAARNRPRPARPRPRRDSAMSAITTRHRLADEGDLVLGQHERRDVGRQLRACGTAAAAAPATAAAKDRQASAPHARPAHARAALASMPRISACACGLRTNAACSMPGNADRRRSGHGPASSGRSSIRLIGRPTARDCVKTAATAQNAAARAQCCPPTIRSSRCARPSRCPDRTASASRASRPAVGMALGFCGA